MGTVVRGASMMAGVTDRAQAIGKQFRKRGINLWIGCGIALVLSVAWYGALLLLQGRYLHTLFYERGPIPKLGGGPDTVAAAVERAITADRPRTRYAVTPSAHLFIWLRRVLPDRAWDAVVGTVYPQPGR